MPAEVEQVGSRARGRPPLAVSPVSLYARDGLVKSFGSVTRGLLERRIALILGMDRGLAHELIAAAWRRNDGRLALRAAAFLAATTRLSPRLVPRGIRERAIHAFVWWLLRWHPDDPRLALAYAGHDRALGSRSCPGLLPS
jgi:hypothetical protein